MFFNQNSRRDFFRAITAFLAVGASDSKGSDGHEKSMQKLNRKTRANGFSSSELVDDMVQSVDDLKSVNPDPKRVILVKGYNSAGDGGGGVFWWDAGAEAANADGGTSIASTVSGYTDGDANEGLWRRSYDNELNFRWWGPAEDATTDDSSLFKDALQVADNRNEPLSLGGGIYGMSPEITIPCSIELRRGTIRVCNQNSDYDFVFDVQSGVVMEEFVVDQRQIDTHDGRGEGIRITGDDVWLKGVEVYGERPVQPNNDLSNCFRPLNCADVTLEKCEAYQAAGSGFRPKEPERLRILDCKSINWQDKGFGYDSDNDNVGSVYVDGFYIKSDTTERSAGGFLVDPGAGTKLAKLVVDNLEINGGVSNPCKLEYIYEVEVQSIAARSPNNTDNAIKVHEVDRASFGRVLVDDRFKVEFTTGPVHVDSLYCDMGGASPAIRHGGRSRLTIDHLEVEGIDGEVIRMNSDETDAPNRACTLQFIDFEAATVNSFIWVDGNNNYPGDAMRVLDVKWGTNVSRFSSLAPGENEAIKVQRGGASDLPVFMTNENPANKTPAKTSQIPRGSIFRHYDVTGGNSEPIYWVWDGSDFYAGPTI